MWAITKIVITCLIMVVTAYVLNQSKGHWLLSNALITVINLIMAMEFQLDPKFANGNETCD
jgi:ABC-type xylose transport system permease subunit